MNNIIDQIIKYKSRVVFVSPHLDDAVFSAGGLMSELKGKTKIIVINVFTRSSKPYTFSANKFLSQCGFRNIKELYEQRLKEDKEVLSKLDIRPLDLKFQDALFRKKEILNIVEEFLGKIFPEFLHIYPTYRFNIVNGRIPKNDRVTLIKIKKQIKNLRLTKRDYLFAPMGIGNHVDHILVSKACKEFIQFTNVVFWADYPYVLSNNKIDADLSFTPNWKLKIELIKGYKSQFKAIFGSTETIRTDEKFYISNVKKTKLSEIYDTYTRYLKLLYQTPKDFIYSFLNYNNGYVKISVYDPKLGVLAKKIINKIKAVDQKTKVYLLGSVGLKIAGVGDIDIFIETPISNFSILHKKISNIFGLPTKISHQFIEWKFLENNTPIEITLCISGYKRLIDQLKIFKLLKQHSKEYESLKWQMNGFAKKEYVIRRMEFFNNLRIKNGDLTPILKKVFDKI